MNRKTNQNELIEEVKAEEVKDMIKQDEKPKKEIQMPNILVEDYLKEKLPESFSEEQKKREEDFFKNLGDNIEYVNRLEGTPYSFTTEGFGYVNRQWRGIEKVSNLLAVPIKKYNYETTEGEMKSYIELIGIIAPTSEELPSITVPIEQIEGGNWFINPLWGLKVKFELPPQKSIQINCIKELSKYMEEETIYEFIGFTEIEGKKVFLHTGGAIGSDKKIKVNLEDEVLNNFVLTDKSFDIKDTLPYTLGTLDIAPRNKTLPILSLTFMSPLTSTFEELGIPLGFLTWVQGPQQSRKTSMVSAFCSHFGNFNKNRSPMNFLDGIPSAREKSAKLKDVLTLCDDFFPSSNKQEASDMRKFTEKLISLVADRMAGARSKSDGKMRKTYRAKGQIIATRRVISRIMPKSYVSSTVY